MQTSIQQSTHTICTQFEKDDENIMTFRWTKTKNITFKVKYLICCKISILNYVRGQVSLLNYLGCDILSPWYQVDLKTTLLFHISQRRL